jgi:putative transposase
VLLKTYKYKVYPTRKQITALDDMISKHRWLYNEALGQRKTAYEERQESVSYFQQSAWLTKDRQEQDRFATLNVSSCQRTLRRLDKAFQAFFRRIKSGDIAGYPRFKGYNRFNSVEYTYSDGCKFRDNGKLYIQNIGEIKIKLHRSIKGVIKTMTIKREAGRYYVCFSVEEITIPLPKTDEVIGIDLGISNFVTTSDSQFFAPPKHFRKSEKKLRRLQRSVTRKVKGSKTRRKSIRNLQRCHQHIANQRRDIAHKIAKKLVDQYAMIAVENLNTQGLIKNHHLAKSIMDASWNLFILILISKAEYAGRKVIKVNPQYTSQLCSQCGNIVKKDLSIRIHDCPHCGLKIDRDVNASINILKRGRDTAFVA